MEPIELYRQIFNVHAPWSVTSVELQTDPAKVLVRVTRTASEALHCPVCKQQVPGYDTNTREWRHLDTCQYPTIVQADVPRVECPEHGVKQVSVPWAEDRSRFTLLFEALVLDWLNVAATSDVARLFNLSWSSIDRIRTRAVQRGLARRAAVEPVHLSVDEVAISKGHSYQTIISDQDSGAVLHVADGRTTESLQDFLESLSEPCRAGIETISMDMWPAYISAATAVIPEAEKKICFDKFHVAQHLSKAVDMVRRHEHRSLLKQGKTTLKKTKYLWLRNPENMSDQLYTELEQLSQLRLKTARAWSLKESGMYLWKYVSRHWGKTGWTLWYNKAIRSRLDPIKKVARMIKKHLWGILNAMHHKRSNGLAESINSRIVRIKNRACGFRNPERMKTMIYFHLGKLDLYPRAV